MDALPLSLDWEDWFQLCCPPYDQAGTLDRYACRLPQATERVLELLADLGAQATWFCLADQAQRHPELLRRIVQCGHRIGLHGLTHRRVTQLDQAGFRAFIQEGRARLSDLSGAEIQGFRAPEWSLRGSAESFWKEVRDQGFQFDSSLAPLPMLGRVSRSRRARELAPGFWELPPPVMGHGMTTLPLWGWGMRLLPEFFLKRRLDRFAAAGTPIVLHPWELDEGQPRLPDSVGFGHHFAHGAGIRGFGARLRRLLEGRTLVSLETWLEPRMEARPEPRREEKQELQRESWSASRFEPADAVPNRTFRAPDRRDSPYPPGGAKGTLIP